MGGPGGSAEVVSIAARTAGRAGFKRMVAERMAAARASLDMTAAEYADYLEPRLGYRPSPATVERWEQAGTAPAEVLLAADGMAAAATLLDSVPNSFPAEAITGPWITAYRFAHAGRPHYHADLAQVIAEGERLVRAVNHPPEPRTQGRSSPFRNEIEGQLFGRHLIGTWRNTSDTRYFGTLQLAVLPGETVMDGHYTGLASDIEVSAEHWRWVRVAPGDLAGLVLREPSAIYDLVMTRTQDDPPIPVDDIREDA